MLPVVSLPSMMDDHHHYDLLDSSSASLHVRHGTAEDIMSMIDLDLDQMFNDAINELEQGPASAAVAAAQFDNSSSMLYSFPPTTTMDYSNSAVVNTAPVTPNSIVDDSSDRINMRIPNPLLAFSEESSSEETTTKLILPRTTEENTSFQGNPYCYCSS